MDFHLATDEERLAAYRNVHEVWGGGLTLEQHVERRLRSVQHNRAEWYVGTERGTVVTSLACYALWFWLQGEQLPGIAIGSVHTLRSHRGRGHASSLLAWVEDACASRGARLSLLYSDIDPAYYAKLGYQLCPSAEGWAEPQTEGRGSTSSRLIRCTADVAAEVCVDLYNEFHGSLPLAVARPRKYWQYLLSKSPDDLFFRWESAERRPGGYVRLGRDAAALRIADYAVAGDRSALEAMYGSVVAEAASLGAPRIGGWLPDVPAATRWFTIQPRATEQTMVKSLDPDGPLDPDSLQAARYFCEIDHV